MIEHTITSKIQESMHRMVEHLKDKNSNKNNYNITQPCTQLKMQMWIPSQIQTTAHKTTVHQPPPNTKYNLQKHSNKTNKAFWEQNELKHSPEQCYNSDCLTCAKLNIGNYRTKWPTCTHKTSSTKNYCIRRKIRWAKLLHFSWFSGALWKFFHEYKCLS